MVMEMNTMETNISETEMERREPKFRSLFDRAESSGLLEEQRNKERILMAAAALFANKGYAGTAVREIVEAAGVTKPTLYYYFKNKEDLYVKLMDVAMGTFDQLLKGALARPGDMRTRLKGLYTDFLEAFMKSVDLLRLVNAMIFGPPGSTPDYDLTERHEQLESALIQILRGGVSEGEVREERIDEVKFLLLGVLRSMQCVLVMEPSVLHMELTPRAIGRTIDCIFDGAGVGVHGEEVKR